MKSKASFAKARQQATCSEHSEGRDPEAVDPDPELHDTAVSTAGDAASVAGQLRVSATEVIDGGDDAWPWKFLGPELAEEEKVEEGAVAAGARKKTAVDETQPLPPPGEALFLRELDDAIDRIEGQPKAVIRHRMRELWKRQTGAVAASAATTDGEDMLQPDAEVDDVPPPPVERVDSDTYMPQPGAYRVRVGHGPAFQRASSEDHSVFTELTGDPHASSGRHHRRPPRTEDPMYQVEANLVIEEETEPAAPPMLVTATPIRRKRQVMIMTILALAVIAIIVGLSMGLTVNRPVPTPAPTTEAPTLSPTSQLDEQFRPTLPQHTLDSLRNKSSPQYRAYEWVTKIDQVPLLEVPDEAKLELRLERMKQRFALASLFFSTGGSSRWKKNRWWLNSTSNECQWSGCCCGSICQPEHSWGYDDDHLYYGELGAPLTGLDLSFNDLERSLPREVGLLRSLISLDLRKNALTGLLPTELGELTLLYNLAMSRNLFTGVIPTEIGSLSGLRQLHLNRNGLAGPIPMELGFLARLTSVDLSDNLFRGGIPEEIGKLLELQGFTASQNYFSGVLPSSIGRLMQLTSLDLSDNNIDGSIPRSMRNLAHLVTLDLSQNKLTSLPKSLGLLSSLTVLDVSKNALNSTIPMQLGRLARLRVLFLQENYLTGPIPPALGQLSSLSGLNLSYNLLSSIPTQLGLLGNLQDLDLSFSGLGGTIPTEFGQLSSLSSLSLSKNRLKSTIPTQLGLLTSLLRLALSGASSPATSYPTGTSHSLSPMFEGPIPTELGNLAALTYLDLAGNYLSSTIPTQLGLLANLQYLFLWINELEAIPPELGQLSALSSLSVSGNQLNSTIPTQFGLLINLQELHLGYNLITGPIPTQLGQLSAMTMLDLSSNAFNATIPTQLGLLTNLQGLNLADNLITGPIPTELGLLSNLAFLSLGENRLTGSVPTEVCERSPSSYAVAYVDCLEVECECCMCTDDGADDV
jgi:Leucine-rich repeat (LRR) protein